jgi:hypothetical protein
MGGTGRVDTLPCNVPAPALFDQDDPYEATVTCVFTAIPNNLHIAIEQLMRSAMFRDREKSQLAASWVANCIRL